MTDDELIALAQEVWPGADIGLEAFGAGATLVARGETSSTLLAAIQHRGGARGALEAVLLHLARAGTSARNEEVARQNARIRELDRKVKEQAKHIRILEQHRSTEADRSNAWRDAASKQIKELEAKLAAGAEKP